MRESPSRDRPFSRPDRGDHRLGARGTHDTEAVGDGALRAEDASDSRASLRARDRIIKSGRLEPPGSRLTSGADPPSRDPGGDVATERLRAVGRPRPTPRKDSPCRDPPTQGDLARPLEPGLFEHPERAAAEEGVRGSFAGVVLGVSLDRPAPGPGNVSECLAQGERGDPLPSTVAIDEEAGDAPVGRLRPASLVLFSASNVRELIGGSELTPTYGVGAVEDQGCVRPALADAGLLQFAIPSRPSLVLARFKLEGDAPASAKDTVVLLHETGEGRPRGRRERLGGQVHRGSSPAPGQSAPTKNSSNWPWRCRPESELPPRAPHSPRRNRPASTGRRRRLPSTSL